MLTSATVILRQLGCTVDRRLTMTKRVLIVGARDDRPRARVDPGPSVMFITDLLEQLGGWSMDVIEGHAATRAGILDGLGRLASSVEPEDDVLFYFFGHGGAVRFTDAPAQLGDRPVFYLSASRRHASEEMTGVLDMEMSTILADIDEVCGNVSVILDCCHSAQIVRGRVREEAAPSWLRDAELEHTPRPGHRIVRLTASSSLNYAFARRLENGSLGLLTEGFVNLVREADGAIDRLCWDTVAHRVREYALQARRNEEQWVTLAGPGHRLLFSREHVVLPRSVGFVADRDDAGGWLRAGLLQGVELGDVWGIAGLTLDARHQPLIRTEVRVVDLDLNRARVESLDGSAEVNCLPDGSSALLLRARERRAIVVDGPPPMQHAVADSALVCLANPGGSSVWASLSWDVHTDRVDLRLRRTDGSVELADSFSDPGTAIIWAIGVLEDWARGQIFLTALERCPVVASEQPVAITWRHREQGPDQSLPVDDGVVELQDSDQLSFGLHHRGLTPETWYVSAVEIGIDGHATLVDPSEPDGRAVEPVEPQHGQSRSRRACNFELGHSFVWPRGVARGQTRPVTLVFLMSLRPIELGHLVAPMPAMRVDEREPVGTVTRRTGTDPGWVAPVVTHKWSWVRLRCRVRAGDAH
jgi:hypothetical protein